MDDPFLQDAIEGYDSVEGDHLPAIEKLERQLARSPRRVKRVWIGAAAALLLLLIGISYLFDQHSMEEEIVVASPGVVQEEKGVASPPRLKDTVLVAEHAAPAPASPIHQESVHEEIVEEKVVQETPARIETRSGMVAQSIPSDEETRSIARTPLPIDHEPLSKITTIVAEEEEPLLVSGRVVDETGENAGDITLKANDTALNEVVVVAFGTQKKELVVGSVSTVKERSSVNEVQRSTFGEEEFKDYFIENHDKTICEGQDITFVVEFFIDPNGRPASIDIKENSCPALEIEIKRLLLGSPLWSEINQKVTLEIALPR